MFLSTLWSDFQLIQIAMVIYKYKVEVIFK